jgi:tripartite-type tricarboxylate transporter receptor subunit TctC
MKRTSLLLALSLAHALAQGQAWPTKTVHAIVPVGAGSSTDIVHRLVLEQLSAELGRPVVVENRTGAGGTIGTALVAKAKPDGYTLLANGSAHTIAPALYKSLPYDPGLDFVPIAPVGVSACVLVVSAAKRFAMTQQLVAAAKARPGVINFSSVGIGTATHLAAERFAASAGIDVLHVPFKGGAEAMLEVMAGRVEFFFGPSALVLPNIRGGKLSALAVNTAERSAQLPNVPTLREAGYADAEYPIWFGLFAPAGTPRQIVESMNHEVLKAARSRTVQEKFSTLGIEPLAMSPDAFRIYVEKEIALNAALAKKVGLKAD